jgi:hypothetical protein
MYDSLMCRCVGRDGLCLAVCLWVRLSAFGSASCGYLSWPKVSVNNRPCLGNLQAVVELPPADVGSLSTAANAVMDATGKEFSDFSDNVKVGARKPAAGTQRGRERRGFSWALFLAQ